MDLNGHSISSSGQPYRRSFDSDFPRSGYRFAAGLFGAAFQALPPGLETMSMNQYVGFLHASIRSMANEDWELTFQYDQPYCAYFASHSSSWQLWLADALRERLTASGSLSATVDGQC